MANLLFKLCTCVLSRKISLSLVKFERTCKSPVTFSSCARGIGFRTGQLTESLSQADATSGDKADQKHRRIGASAPGYLPNPPNTSSTPEGSEHEGSSSGRSRQGHLSQPDSQRNASTDFLLQQFHECQIGLPSASQDHSELPAGIGTGGLGSL